MGLAATQGAKAWGKKALLRAALIPAGILAATPAGWLTAGFLGADFLWDQYKDYRDGNIRIDEMRARGSRFQKMKLRTIDRYFFKAVFLSEWAIECSVRTP